MKAKINLEKFICSLMKRYYEIHNIDPLTTRCWLDKVLRDQGLEYKDGEIVEIPQDEQKLAKWTDSDEEHFQHSLLAIKISLYTQELRKELVDWLKNVKQRLEQ